MNSTEATTATIVTKPKRFAAGCYKGTITVEGVNVEYRLERCDKTNSESWDWGFWKVYVAGDCRDSFETMREAFASVDGDWYMNDASGFLLRR